MFYLSLDELSSEPVNSRLLGVNRMNIYSFFEKDYLPETNRMESSLIGRVQSTASRLGVRDLIASIDLLTNVRMLGYVFNPVSFYFCFGGDDRLLCCICEVGNTFGEKKVFLVEPDLNGLLIKRQKKFFYVSPFTKLDQEFYFNIRVPGESVNILINTMESDTPIVKSSLKGRRIPLTDVMLVSLLLRYSWATAKVIALIHFHALLLWIKQVPFHRKEEDWDMQVDILNAKIRANSQEELSTKVKKNGHIS